MVVVDPEKIEWQRVEQLPKGAWAKLLRLDEETGAVTVLSKFDKGFHEARHKHPCDCFITVLEGEGMVFDGKKVKKGMYFFTPAGVEHGPLNAPEGCVLLIHFYASPW